MKKKDWILAIILVLFIGATIYVHQIVESEHAGFVRIVLAGKEVGFYELSQNEEIKVGNTNVICIEDGEVRVISSTCEDQICVKQTAIHNVNDGILCLPNHLVVMIVNTEVPPLDAIAQ